MVATTNFRQLASLIAAHCDQPFSAVMACIFLQLLKNFIDSIRLVKLKL